jgi:hypothetical protein
MSEKIAWIERLYKRRKINFHATNRRRGRVKRLKRFTTLPPLDIIADKDDSFKNLKPLLFCAIVNEL